MLLFGPIAVKVCTLSTCDAWERPHANMSISGVASSTRNKPLKSGCYMSRLLALETGAGRLALENHCSAYNTVTSVRKQPAPETGVGIEQNTARF